MDELEVINNIIAESVRDSSYITVIISSAVFLLYTLITNLISYFKSKSKNKPLLEMAASLKENTAYIIKLGNVLDKTLQDTERKQNVRCENAIDTGFKAFGFKLTQEAAGIIAHNNIKENKEYIINNINKLVSTEYYKLYSSLSVYEIKEVNVASKLKEEWIKEIADNIIAIVYNGQDAISRITQVSNRINISINEYSTYVNNKTFNT
jgi:hypothetical protein